MANDIGLGVGTTSGGGNYSYTPESLNEYASMVDKTADTIAQLRKDIDTIALEVKNAWKGTSADEYYNNISKYNSDLNLLNVTLNGVANNLRNTATRQQERAAETKANVENNLS